MKKRTKQQIGYAAAALVVIAGLFAFAGGEPADTGGSVAFSQGALAAAERSFDFGSIRMGNGKVTHRFELKNNAAEAVTVQKVYTSCMCTTATLVDGQGKTLGTFGMPGHGGLPSQTSEKVGPGETMFVDAVFDPAAHGPSGVGLARRSVYVETNSAVSPKLELTFQAMVMP